MNYVLDSNLELVNGGFSNLCNGSNVGWCNIVSDALDHWWSIKKMKSIMTDISVTIDFIFCKRHILLPIYAHIHQYFSPNDYESQKFILSIEICTQLCPMQGKKYLIV